MRRFVVVLASCALAAVWSCANHGQILDSGGVGGGGASGPTTSSSGSSSGGGSSTSGSSTSGSSTSGSSTSGSSTSGSSSSGAGGATGAGGSSSGAGGGGGDPYNTPVVCSSNVTYVTGNNESMTPGKACKSCHVLFGQASGKTFDVGGTVYLTAHEPDNCNGTGVQGAIVVITDAMNVDTALPVNAEGNFYHHDLFGVAAFKAPFKTKVVYNGKERKMVAAVTNGDCNACHTESGTMNAPGRIMLP